ncbi:peptidylprolyl isomerase [Thermorudis peleae]|uniref:peptidylprolyl isomerase n=1 Tax=Thermorudis peleae TaxID=1382356 RepID=UPI0009DFDB34|nr:peptidylprolyl isomerase [Thermorudis peleae]MBX6753178.1 peptidylprolyl isomerase [Thermorudis peleae]
MLDRIRRRFRGDRFATEPQRRRTRREREQAQQRLVILVTVITLALVFVILGVGSAYQYLYLPRQVLVEVNGQQITRGDYWKMRKLVLLNEIAQYQQLASLVSGQQSVQYQQLAQQAQSQLSTVERDPVDRSTLDQMVDDLLIVQHMGDLGVTISDQEVDQYLLSFFAPAPLASPTPTLGVDATAAAWATATATATVPTPTPTPSATATATPAKASTTPTGTPGSTPTPAASVTATPATTTPTTSATPSGTPAPTSTPGTPVPTATPTPTLSPGQAQATATAQLGQYQRSVLNQTGMSLSDFKRLYVRPMLAREKVQRVLQERVPLRAEQIHAAHILVSTEDAAKAIITQLQQGADFADLAKRLSIDSTTAVNGGDLGWFPRGYMPKAFDDVAFQLQPGQFGGPVKTEYGWHVIKVLEREADRPLSVNMLQVLRDRQLQQWLDQLHQQAKIVWHAGLQPAVTPSVPAPFEPPPDAPPTPTPTPLPTPTPGPTPTGTPPVPAGTPAAQATPTP